MVKKKCGCTVNDLSWILLDAVYGQPFLFGRLDPCAEDNGECRIETSQVQDLASVRSWRESDQLMERKLITEQ